MATENPIMKALKIVLKSTITIGVVVLLIGKLGWQSIVNTISQAEYIWLVYALIVFVISIVMGVFQWQILLKNRKIPLPFKRAFKLYFIGMFFNNFIFGGIVGDAVKVASIHSKDGKGLAGLAATFLDRFAGLWAMCGFAVIGSFILLQQKNAMTNGKIETAMIALFVTFILFAGIMVFLVWKPLQRLFFSLVDKLHSSKATRVKEIVSEMLIEANDIHVLGSVSILSGIIQFLRIGVHALVAASLGLLTMSNFQYFFIFVPIIAMLMVIPLPFGIREAAGGALFAFAGFPADAAFVMGFLASLVGIAASFIGGLFFVTSRTHLIGKKKHENLDRCPVAQ